MGGSSGSGSGGKGGGEACLEHAVEPARASRVIRGAQIRRGPPAFGGGASNPVKAKSVLSAVHGPWVEPSGPYSVSSLPEQEKR